jgi:hypothetical protein
MVCCSNSKVPPPHSMLCQGQINMASYHYPRESTKNQSHSKYYVWVNEGTATSVQQTACVFGFRSSGAWHHTVALLFLSISKEHQNVRRH